MSIDRRSFLKLIGAAAAASILPEPKEPAPVAEGIEPRDPHFIAGKKTIEGVVSGFKSSREIKETLSRELEKQRAIFSIYEQHALIAMVLTDIFDVSTWHGSVHEVNLTFRSPWHWMALDNRRFDFTLYLPGTPLWESSRLAFSGMLHVTGGTLYPNGPPSYSVRVSIDPLKISSAPQGKGSVILIPGNKGSETDFVSIKYKEDDSPEDQTCNEPEWSFRS